MNKIIKKIADKTVVIKQKIIEKKDLIKNVAAVSIASITMVTTFITGCLAMSQNSETLDNQPITEDSYNFVNEQESNNIDANIKNEKNYTTEYKLIDKTINDGTLVYVLNTLPDEFGLEISSVCLTSNSVIDLEIPKEYNNMPIKRIGSNAFVGCENISQVFLPDSITSIGNRAFYYCKNLKQISIPDSVVSIGTNAFGTCEKLQGIEVDSTNKNYISHDGVLFNKNMTTLIQCPSAKINLENYEIPESVTSISKFAFFNCDNLSRISIPNGVTSINEGTFSQCDNLTQVTLPDNITSIDADAFRGCKNLTKINVPDTVTSIGNYAFSNCENLSEIKLPNNISSIGASAFSECKNLTKLALPDNITSIDNFTFYKCDNLSQITIPDSTKYIGEFAFCDCKNLTQINVKETGKRNDDTRTSLDYKCLEGTSVSTLNIPKGFKLDSISAAGISSNNLFRDVEINEYTPSNSHENNSHEK